MLESHNLLGGNESARGHGGVAGGGVGLLINRPFQSMPPERRVAILKFNSALSRCNCEFSWGEKRRGFGSWCEGLFVSD